MGQRPTVRWNEKARPVDGVGALPRRLPPQGRAGREGRRPAGSRRAARPAGAVAGPWSTPAARQATFDEVIDAWFAAGCPNVSPTRTSRHARAKSPEHRRQRPPAPRHDVRPVIGHLWVDRTATERLEEMFAAMAAQGKPRAPSTAPGTTSTRPASSPCASGGQANPAADVLLPARQPSKARKSFTIEQAESLLMEAIPADPRPAMWLTGLMCGFGPASSPAFVGRSSTSTATRRASTSSSGRSRSTTATPARSPEDGAGRTPDRPPPAPRRGPQAPPGGDARSSASTTPRASSSAPATAPRCR